MYQVSWIGWETPKYDTWETLANLTSCGEKLREFYTKRVREREAAPSAQKRNFEVPPDPRTNFERRNEFADTICPPPCQSELEAFFHRFVFYPNLNNYFNFHTCLFSFIVCVHPFPCVRKLQSWQQRYSPL